MNGSKVSTEFFCLTDQLIILQRQQVELLQLLARARNALENVGKQDNYVDYEGVYEVKKALDNVLFGETL